MTPKDSTPQRRKEFSNYRCHLENKPKDIKKRELFTLSFDNLFKSSFQQALLKTKTNILN
jgi:hypothetical protein